MITRSDISNFFDYEAEAAMKSWEATMKLPLADRIRKRKAIKDVYLVRDYCEPTKDREYLYKVKISKNLSDFKEGDPLLLHEDGEYNGMKCTLYSFEEEGVICVSVSLYDRKYDLEPFYDVPLVLDKDVLDLRDRIYCNFTAGLPFNIDYWNDLLLNSKKLPHFIEDKKCYDLYKDLVKSLEMLPCQENAVLKSLYADDYYLIQGPPGTGKSFVLGLIILMELMYFKHKVAVVGPNHMAINNTLEKVFDFCPNLSDYMPFAKVGKPYNAPSCSQEFNGKEYEIENIINLNSTFLNNAESPWLIGLTPHSFYTSKARNLKCDTLIIDEAGQMTIPLAMMGMVNAKKVILAGDHKQLPPIITSESVPDYMKKSAFETLMTEGNYTLLDTSFRMCEPICEYVSDLFYDGKVKANNEGCGDMVKCDDSLYSFDKPVVVHQVDDDGCQASEKEAEFIVNTIVGFLKKGVPAKEIAVLAPFRAQAATVRRGIRKLEDISDEDKSELVADTVDKMQGQEREVIIYSFTAGDPDYISEMADFLYKPNKLNVAFSRAKSKLIIVGNFDKILENAGDGFPHIQGMLNHKNVTKV